MAYKIDFFENMVFIILYIMVLIHKKTKKENLNERIKIEGMNMIGGSPRRLYEVI